MKLYLSSYRVPTPQDLIDLFDKPIAEVKMAIIPNAGDYYAQRAWDYKVNDSVQYFRTLGFNADTIDLRQHDEMSLPGTLAKYDFLWVSGGNTFCLRYEMQRSSFDKIIGEYTEKGVVFGGESAGAIVAGESLRGAELADQPEFAEAVIFEGLNLLPAVLVPHMDNKKFVEAVAQMAEMHKDNPGRILLNDNQAYVVNGDLKQVVTAV